MISLHKMKTENPYLNKTKRRRFISTTNIVKNQINNSPEINRSYYEKDQLKSVLANTIHTNNNTNNLNNKSNAPYITNMSSMTNNKNFINNSNTNINSSFHSRLKLNQVKSINNHTNNLFLDKNSNYNTGNFNNNSRTESFYSKNNSYINSDVMNLDFREKSNSQLYNDTRNRSQSEDKAFLAASPNKSLRSKGSHLSKNNSSQIINDLKRRINQIKNKNIERANYRLKTIITRGILHQKTNKSIKVYNNNNNNNNNNISAKFSSHKNIGENTVYNNDLDSGYTKDNYFDDEFEAMSFSSTEKFKSSSKAITKSIKNSNTQLSFVKNNNNIGIGINTNNINKKIYNKNKTENVFQTKSNYTSTNNIASSNVSSVTINNLNQNISKNKNNILLSGYLSNNEKKIYNDINNTNTNINNNSKSVQTTGQFVKNTKIKLSNLSNNINNFNSVVNNSNNNNINNNGYVLNNITSKLNLNNLNNVKQISNKKDSVSDVNSNPNSNMNTNMNINNNIRNNSNININSILNSERNKNNPQQFIGDIFNKITNNINSKKQPSKLVKHNKNFKETTNNDINYTNNTNTNVNKPNFNIDKFNEADEKNALTDNDSNIKFIDYDNSNDNSKNDVVNLDLKNKNKSKLSMPFMSFLNNINKNDKSDKKLHKYKTTKNFQTSDVFKENEEIDINSNKISNNMNDLLRKKPNTLSNNNIQQNSNIETHQEIKSSTSRNDITNNNESQHQSNYNNINLNNNNDIKTNNNSNHIIPNITEAIINNKSHLRKNLLFQDNTDEYYNNYLNTLPLKLQQFQQNSSKQNQKLRLKSITRKYKRRLNTNTLLLKENKRSVFIFKNVYDSLSDEELEEEEYNNDQTDKYKKNYSIDPTSPFPNLWELLITYVYIIATIYYSLLLSFYLDSYSFKLFFIDVIFWLFLVSNFMIKSFTGIYDIEDTLIFNFKKSLFHFLKDSLFFDLILILSFIVFSISYVITYYLSYNTYINNYVLLFGNDYFNSKNNSVYNNLNDLSLLDISFINHGEKQEIIIFIQLYYFLNTLSVMRFVKNFSLTIMIKSETKNYSFLENGVSGNNSNSKKRKNKNRYSDEAKTQAESDKYAKLKRILIMIALLYLVVHVLACYWITIGKSQHSSSNWIFYYDFKNSNYYHVYFAAIYCCMTSVLTVGYGDMVPNTTIERLYFLLLLNIGVIIYSLILSNLSEIFKGYSEKDEIYKMKQEVFSKIINEYRLDYDLIEKINVALHHNYKNYNKDIISTIESLPGSLKNHIYSKMYENKIQKLEFFKDKAFDFVIYTVPLLKSNYFDKHDIILSKGQNLDEMYLVLKGQISLTLGSSYNNFVIARVNSKFHFGDILMFTDERSEFEFVASQKETETLTLSKTDFTKVRVNFYTIVNNILEKSFLIFYSIDQRRQRAIKYFEHYNTFEGFVFREVREINKKLNFEIDKWKHYGRRKSRMLIGNDFFENDKNKEIESLLANNSNYCYYFNGNANELLSQNTMMNRNYNDINDNELNRGDTITTYVEMNGYNGDKNSNDNVLNYSNSTNTNNNHDTNSHRGFKNRYSHQYSQFNNYTINEVEQEDGENRDNTSTSLVHKSFANSKRSFKNSNNNVERVTINKEKRFSCVNDINFNRHNRNKKTKVNQDKITSGVVLIEQERIDEESDDVFSEIEVIRKINTTNTMKNKTHENIRKKFAEEDYNYVNDKESNNNMVNNNTNNNRKIIDGNYNNNNVNNESVSIKTQESLKTKYQDVYTHDNIFFSINKAKKNNTKRNDDKGLVKTLSKLNSKNSSSDDTISNDLNNNKSNSGSGDSNIEAGNSDINSSYCLKSLSLSKNSKGKLKYFHHQNKSKSTNSIKKHLGNFLSPAFKYSNISNFSNSSKNKNSLFDANNIKYINPNINNNNNNTNNPKKKKTKKSSENNNNRFINDNNAVNTKYNNVGRHYCFIKYIRKSLKQFIEDQNIPYKKFIINNNNTYINKTNYLSNYKKFIHSNTVRGNHNKIVSNKSENDPYANNLQKYFSPINDLDSSLCKNNRNRRNQSLVNLYIEDNRKLSKNKIIDYQNHNNTNINSSNIKNSRSDFDTLKYKFETFASKNKNVIKRSNKLLFNNENDINIKANDGYLSNRNNRSSVCKFGKNEYVPCDNKSKSISNNKISNIKLNTISSNSNVGEITKTKIVEFSNQNSNVKNNKEMNERNEKNVFDLINNKNKNDVKDKKGESVFGFKSDDSNTYKTSNLNSKKNSKNVSKKNSNKNSKENSKKKNTVVETKEKKENKGIKDVMESKDIKDIKENKDNNKSTISSILVNNENKISTKSYKLNIILNNDNNKDNKDIKDITNNCNNANISDLSKSNSNNTLNRIPTIGRYKSSTLLPCKTLKKSSKQVIIYKDTLPINIKSTLRKTSVCSYNNKKNINTYLKNNLINLKSLNTTYAELSEIEKNRSNNNNNTITSLGKLHKNSKDNSKKQLYTKHNSKNSSNNSNINNNSNIQNKLLHLKKPSSKFFNNSNNNFINNVNNKLIIINPNEVQSLRRRSKTNDAYNCNNIAHLLSFKNKQNDTSVYFNTKNITNNNENNQNNHDSLNPFSKDKIIEKIQNTNSAKMRNKNINKSTNDKKLPYFGNNSNSNGNSGNNGNIQLNSNYNDMINYNQQLLLLMTSNLTNLINGNYLNTNNNNPKPPSKFQRQESKVRNSISGSNQINSNYLLNKINNKNNIEKMNANNSILNSISNFNYNNNDDDKKDSINKEYIRMRRSTINYNDRKYSDDRYEQISNVKYTNINNINNNNEIEFSRKETKRLSNIESKQPITNITNNNTNINNTRNVINIENNELKKINQQLIQQNMLLLQMSLSNNNNNNIINSLNAFNNINNSNNKNFLSYNSKPSKEIQQDYLLSKNTIQSRNSNYNAKLKEITKNDLNNNSLLKNNSFKGEGNNNSISSNYLSKLTGKSNKNNNNNNNNDYSKEFIISDRDRDSKLFFSPDIRKKKQHTNNSNNSNLINNFNNLSLSKNFNSTLTPIIDANKNFFGLRQTRNSVNRVDSKNTLSSQKMRLSKSNINNFSALNASINQSKLVNNNSNNNKLRSTNYMVNTSTDSEQYNSNINSNNNNLSNILNTNNSNRRNNNRNNNSNTRLNNLSNITSMPSINNINMMGFNNLNNSNNNVNSISNMTNLHNPLYNSLIKNIGSVTNINNISNMSNIPIRSASNIATLSNNNLKGNYFKTENDSSEDSIPTIDKEGYSLLDKIYTKIDNQAFMENSINNNNTISKLLVDYIGERKDMYHRRKSLYITDKNKNHKS